LFFNGHMEFPCVKLFILVCVSAIMEISSVYFFYTIALYTKIIPGSDLQNQ
jgi:hypothetical protein